MLSGISCCRCRDSGLFRTGTASSNWNPKDYPVGAPMEERWMPEPDGRPIIQGD